MRTTSKRFNETRGLSEDIEAYQTGLSSSTIVLRHWPESVSQIRLEGWSTCSHLERGTSTHIKPSIAQETIRVPSWLNPTAVTGSE